MYTIPIGLAQLTGFQRIYYDQIMVAATLAIVPDGRAVLSATETVRQRHPRGVAQRVTMSGINITELDKVYDSGTENVVAGGISPSRSTTASSSC